MLTEEELKEAAKKAEKDQVVEKLLNFYKECRDNGMKKLFVEMNRKYSDLADDIHDSHISVKGDDKAFERFMKLAVESGTMQSNYEQMETYMFGKDDSSTPKEGKKGHEQKVIV